MIASGYCAPIALIAAITKQSMDRQLPSARNNDYVTRIVVFASFCLHCVTVAQQRSHTLVAYSQPQTLEMSETCPGFSSLWYGWVDP